MKTIAELQHTDFEGLVGQEFAIGPLKAKLNRVELGPETPEEFRQQFSLIFDCPEEFGQDSDTVVLSHDSLGAHSVFLNKVMGLQGKQNLQVVFG